MPSAAAIETASTLMTKLDTGLKTVGFDLKDWVKNLDIQSVGLFTLVVVAAVFLFDFGSYYWSSYTGASGAYSSYGRSLATGAAKAWIHRDEFGLDNYIEDVRGGRSLDSVNNVLDSISRAILEFEDPAELSSRKVGRGDKTLGGF
ncbi:unnamed protein product [Meganyctiphanes norvegica]|uniref:Uncharacterized protein n=1 Tax=Meganyctiphanes norvegica TaxID=48144 RepID=A0AAV2QQU8_MEGNR